MSKFNYAMNLTTQFRITARLVKQGTVSHLLWTQARPLHISLAARRHHFDTLKLVKRLEADGLTPEQSQGVLSALKDTIEESLKGATINMVTREDYEKVRNHERDVLLLLFIILLF